MAQVAHRKAVWARLWMRLVAYAMCAPVIVLTVNVAAIFIYAATLQHSSLVLSSPSVWLPELAMVTAIEIIPLLLPAFLAERSNRRHLRAVPPSLCAAFVAIYAVAVIVALRFGLFPMSQLAGRAEEISEGASLAVLLGFYGLGAAAGLMAAFFGVSPFVRRWARRAASGQDISEHF